MANETIAFDEPITEEQLVVIRFFTILTSIFGTLGNLLTIAAILKGKLYRTATFVFILNLSVCNLIHCVIFHPIIAVQSYVGIWTSVTPSCVAFSYGLFVNLGTELWGYTWITINRYVCVVRHHAYTRFYGGPQLTALMLVFSWLFYPILFLLPLTEAWGHFVYAPRKLVCYPFGEYNCEGFCLFIYIIALASTVPVILFCYIAIIRKYATTQKKVGLGRQKSLRAPTGDPVRTESERNKALSELRMAFTILAVIGVFTCFRLPFMVLYLADPSMVRVRPLVHTLLIYIGACSNIINPFIYAFSNKKILNSLRTLGWSWKQTIVLQASNT